MRHVMEELRGVVMETSRVSAALRSLGDLLGDNEEPVADELRPGLGAAVSLIGDQVEAFAADRLWLMEHLVRERVEGQGDAA